MDPYTLIGVREDRGIPWRTSSRTPQGLPLSRAGALPPTDPAAIATSQPRGPLGEPFTVLLLTLSDTASDTGNALRWLALLAPGPQASSLFTDHLLSITRFCRTQEVF